MIFTAVSRHYWNADLQCSLTAVVAQSSHFGPVSELLTAPLKLGQEIIASKKNCGFSDCSKTWQGNSDCTGLLTASFENAEKDVCLGRRKSDRHVAGKRRWLTEITELQCVNKDRELS